MLVRVLFTLGLVVTCCVPFVLLPFGQGLIEMQHICFGDLLTSPDVWSTSSGSRVIEHRSPWKMPDSHSTNRNLHKHWGKRALRTGPIGAWIKPNYIHPLHILPMTFGLGVAYAAYLRYRFVQCREKAKVATSIDPSEYLASDFEVIMYKILPWRICSRFAGWAANLTLPGFMRQTVLRSFARSCGCDINEAAEEDLTKYKSLSEFFRRELKPGLRPVQGGRCIVSPADGTVLHFGPVSNNQLEQVKGITYSLPSFLGPITWDATNKDENSQVNDYYSETLLKQKEGHSLFQCVVYLAPGDYHRFHSPADWTVQYRRHFPGDLLSVRPGFVYWIAGLFNLNERAAYIGQWKHGFFSMTAVGATGVGSIKVDCDQNLLTNSRSHKKGNYYDEIFPVVSDNIEDSTGINFKKGQPFGEFNFGSTIVLIFEAPKDFEFMVQPGQKVKYGERLIDAKYCQRDSGKA